MSAPVCPRRAGEPAPLSAREEQLYGVQTSVLHRDAEHAVYRLRSSDGEVIKTCYPVFPGITITYNDVHASYCQMAAPPRQDWSKSTTAARDASSTSSARTTSTLRRATSPSRSRTHRPVRIAFQPGIITASPSTSTPRGRPTVCRAFSRT